MKIGVVGGGISGLGSGIILSQAHEVHLFESEGRIGGHAYTYKAHEHSTTIPMDVGFLVYNELTYPHLIELFKYLNVKTVDSDMSLSIRSIEKNLEWSGTSFNSLFGQRRNFLRPKFYQMLREILRFNKEAESNLLLARRHAWTLRDLFVNRRFSTELSENYILPIGAAIWSTPENGMLDYPAETFLTFFINHKLLQVNDRPIWKTVLGGSINYVEKAVQKISKVHSNARVLSVLPRKDGVLIRTEAGEDFFDRVIMATSAPIALSLIHEPTAREREILSAFRTEPNSAILHHDQSLMPARKRCWSSWNVLAGAGNKVSLTYHLNKLQPLKTSSEYLLTLNAHSLPKDQIAQFSFQHPLFTHASIRAQNELPLIQGQSGIYYAGAWTRYGFHEDGLLSAVRIAKSMGVSPPWEVTWKAA